MDNMNESFNRGLSNIFKTMNGTWEPPSREETINSIEKTIEGISNMSPNYYKVTFTPSFGIKFKKSQNEIAAKISNDFKSVKISDLVFDTTHKKKYIKLKVITRILKLNSIMFIGEDEDKTVLKIAIYNFADYFGTSYVEELETIFKKDSSFVIIIEPYYKFFNDGFPGIRVDNPKEILVFENEKEVKQFLDKINREDQNEMKIIADNLMKEKKYNEAITQYKKIVEIFGGNAVIYSNISEGYLKISNYKLGLLYAKMSLKLDEKNVKSQFRVVRALYGMKKFQDALDFYNVSNLKNMKDIPEIEQLKNEIINSLKQNENKNK